MVSTDIEVASVDGVGGAELAGPIEFGVVGVDGDDLFRADQRRAGDRGVADAAAPIMRRCRRG